MEKIIDFKSRKIKAENISQNVSGYEDEKFKARMQRINEGLKKIDHFMRQLKESHEEE